MPNGVFSSESMTAGCASVIDYFLRKIAASVVEQTTGPIVP